jgi:hypothetical protein
MLDAVKSTAPVVERWSMTIYVSKTLLLLCVLTVFFENEKDKPFLPACHVLSIIIIKKILQNL